MIRTLFEKLAYKILWANYMPRAIIVYRMVAEGKEPVDIAAEVAGQKVILGSIILLAANHRKKTSRRD
jgi:hypothetical protein